VDILNNVLAYDLSAFSDYALLVLRLVVAVVFFVAFKNKVVNVKKFAKTNGIPVPLAFTTVYAELTGALSLSLGVFTQLGALLLMGLMLGTMSMHIFKWRSPYWASKGGWEYDLFIFSSCFVIATIGGGSVALLPVL
jgi:putative oxidoreductase